MSADDERTVEELREELRDRDLKVSGTKEELLERLATNEDGPRTTSTDGPSPALTDVVRTIRDGLSGVLGAEVERVTGLARGDDGWQAQVDVLEVSRIPPSTDVLATYEVTTDPGGNIGGFERIRRFRRSEAEDER